MEQKHNEDIWLGCGLGFRVGKYLSAKPDAAQKDLIEVLGQIASGELTLTDPGENAARYSQNKDVSQSVDLESIRGDRVLAQKALDQLTNQQDE